MFTQLKNGNLRAQLTYVGYNLESRTKIGSLIMLNHAFEMKIAR